MSALRITDRGELVFEGARIIFKNFSGEKTKYNKNGWKEFHVVIDDPEMAHVLDEEGWNVKTRVYTSQDGEETKYYHLQVAVMFGNFPPTVYMVNGKTKTPLNDDTIGSLDSVRISAADIVVRPRRWTDDDGNERIKAYLKTLYASIEVEDEFADKYMDDAEEMPFA